MQPTLTPVAQLPIYGTTGLQWAMRQLYVCSTQAVHTAFLSLPAAGGCKCIFRVKSKHEDERAFCTHRHPFSAPSTTINLI